MAGLRRLLRLDAFRLALYVGLLFPLLHFVNLVRGVDLPVISRVEHAAQDYALTRLRGPRPTSGRVVIVAIDNKSVREEGRWPWPREKMAKLVEQMGKGGVASVGFDIVWDADDEVGRRLARVASVVKTAKGESPRPGGPLEDAWAAAQNPDPTVAVDRDPTELLADAIEDAKNVTLGFTFLTPDQVAGLGADVDDDLQKVSFFQIDPVHVIENGRLVPVEPAPQLPQHWAGVVRPLDVLLSVASSGGYFTSSTDDDGVIRKYVTVGAVGASNFASLGIATLARTLGPEGQVARVTPIAKVRGSRFLQAVRLGDVTVDVDDAGFAYLNYYGQYRDFPTWSATDLLHGRIPADQMRGKVAVVGTTAVATWDQRVTPFDAFAPGVITHATFMENVLRGELLVRTQTVVVAEVVVLILTAFALALLFSRVSSLLSAPALVVAAGVTAGTGVVALQRWNLLLAVALPIMQQFAIFLAATSYRFFNEERERRKARETFSRFLAPAIVEQVLEREGSLKLGGEKRELTCLFADIRGFTTLSEKLDPHVLLEVLNEYLTPMTDIIVQEHQGTLDKYIGDAIMAFWGAPSPQDDHALRACRAALGMIRKLQELRVGWRERKLPDIDIGVGLNTGPMSVGFLGSQDRFYNYTVLGDAVNLSSRLEGANRQYGTHILIGPITRDMVKDHMVLREVDRVRVKGKREPVRIFELLGEAPASPEQAAFLEAFSWGISAYQAQRWDEAIGRFREAARLAGGDETSEIYVARCEAMRREPPGPQWDGVYEMHSK
ncbi:MAG: adenylate/guanylate cyclase domain-containing protein [Anaeromyxobacter sp.]